VKTFIGIVIGLAILVAFSCSNEGDGFLARILKGGAGGVPVTVESVVSQERQRELAIPATIELSESVEVAAPEDIVVERVLVTEGQAVAAGTELVRLSEGDVTSKLARQRADLKDAQARYDRDAYFAKNKDRLLSEGRIDQTQYDNIDSELEKDDAALEKARQDVAKLEERQASPAVTSPIAGIVQKINAAPGLMAQAGRPIATIGKSDSMTIAFRLPAAYASVARAGQTVKVNFPDLGESASARILSVGTEVDPSDNGFPIKASLANPGARFKSGLHAQVQVPTAEKQRVYVIPEEALLRERGAVFVYTVDKKVAHKVQVIPSETIGTQVEIVRGLKDDDLVVVRGQEKLAEGTVVDFGKR
jgi:membrane fusion protein, multidrug efflux system